MVNIDKNEFLDKIDEFKKFQAEQNERNEMMFENARMKIMTEEFNFCIARKYGNSERLCVYKIHNSDIHYGDDEYATSLLKYVMMQTQTERYHYDNDWSIIKIST